MAPAAHEVLSVVDTDHAYNAALATTLRKMDCAIRTTQPMPVKVAFYAT
jgi:hypothetical protein